MEDYDYFFIVKNYIYFFVNFEKLPKAIAIIFIAIFNFYLSIVLPILNYT